TEGGSGERAPARGSLDKAFLDQIGLDDFFDDVALVAERRRQGFDPDGATSVALGDATQVTPIEVIEAAAVDFETQERRVSGHRTDAHRPFDRGKTADPPEQAHRPPWCSSRPPGDLGGPFGAQFEVEKPSTAADNRRKFGCLVEYEPQRYAEALSQR